MLKKPNLFIVGAPKCGTTSMHEYLAAHPQIFMSAVKEPHFFGEDLTLDAALRVIDESIYIRLFIKAADQKWRGESSVWYLFSHRAAVQIHEFAPDARIIIMLRHPVDMLYSLHGQFLYSGNEDIADFEQAFAAQEDRKHGKRIPKHSRNPGALQYFDVARFAPQVHRYLNVFGRDRLHFILFDEFIKETPRVYRDTLRFLEVDESFAPDFSVMNPTKTGRNSFIIALSHRFPFLRRWYHAIVSPAGRGKVASTLGKLGKDEARPAKVSPELKKKLTPTFHEDVRELEKLIGRSLQQWM